MHYPLNRPKILLTGALAVVGVFFAALPPPVLAQGAVQGTQTPNPQLSNIIPESAAVTFQAKIRSIDLVTRRVTLVGGSGQLVTLIAGPNVRLEMLKSGDTVNAKYYHSVAFLLTQPGTPVPEDQITALVAQNVQTPGGFGVLQTRISGLVVSIDMTAHSLDVVDPSGGGVYTINVVDPARQMAMSTLKVGDTITAVVSQALAVSIEPAPKSWL
jgi:Cu/Ag efflux protein CusF